MQDLAVCIPAFIPPLVEQLSGLAVSLFAIPLKEDSPTPPRPQKASFEISEGSKQSRCPTKTGQTHSLLCGGLWGGAGEMQGGSRQIEGASSRRCFFSGIFSAISVGFNGKKKTEFEIHGTC